MVRLAAAPDTAYAGRFCTPLILQQHLSYINPASLHGKTSAGCRKLGARDIRAIKPIDLMWYDVTGYEEGIEYQILDTSNETHIKVRAAQNHEPSHPKGLCRAFSACGCHVTDCAAACIVRRHQLLVPWLICWQACKTAASCGQAACCTTKPWCGTEVAVASADV